MVRDLNFKEVKVCGEGVFATYYNLSDRSDGGVHVTSRNATTLQRKACSIFITSSVSQDSSQNGNTGFCGVCQSFEIKQGTR